MRLQGTHNPRDDSEKLLVIQAFRFLTLVTCGQGGFRAPETRRYASLCQGREDVRREVVSIVRGSEHVGIGTQGMRTDSVRRMSWALGAEVVSRDTGRDGASKP